MPEPDIGGDLQQATDDDRVVGHSETGFFIVGVGASAGGLEALERMFQVMPETGMAFVIVQHLSPDFKSLMDELLARHTRMPIHRVEDGMVVKPDSLYLIPPKQEMIISDGRLLLTEKDLSQSLSLPIDHFFRSLAQDAGSKSITVVLSGTGSDGSRGICDVHEAGGLVIAQSTESAGFDGMPRSAIDTGIVDAVLDPSQIPDFLTRYANDPARAKTSSSLEPSVDETSLECIFRLLQQSHRIDFHCYKPTTIGRRIERRIQMNHHGDIDEYVRFLEGNPAELDQLYKDLLIGVTRFFRDKNAFDELQTTILPDLLSKHDPKNEFRVWVAACGTGEEAYSIAILIDECLRERNLRMNVKIFATDVHRSSLDFAHAGVYPESNLDEMSAKRRERYFNKTEGGYQITTDIREMIVFAPHNLVKDAPFTRLNLITCRNLLIYLQAVAQKKVLSLFHFGLNTGGLLFMGSSESPGELSEEFDVLSERWKMYRKRRDVRLLADFRGPFGYQTPAQRDSRELRQPIVSPTRDRELLATYDELLDRYMPSAIVVDERRQVAQMFGGAGKYLRIGDGRLSTDLLSLVEGDLKLSLAGALQRAMKSQQLVSCERVRVDDEPDSCQLRIDVQPIRRHAGGGRFLITFESLDPPVQDTMHAGEAINLSEMSRNRVRELEQELRYSKENLQAAVEELETSNEELQATNEELVASNEELQSTNEELHSVNEELYTVNAEYQKKITELTELSNDMNNLLVSTDVHTLFLDVDLCIRKFTPRMAEVFNLVLHDVGRRIDAFAHNIDCEDLTGMIRQVLQTDEHLEQRVQDNRGHHFLMRVLPYRAGEQTAGVVLTLIEISSLVKAQEDVDHQRERFERVIAANRDGIWDWPDVKQDEMWWSPTCYSLLGYEPKEFPARYSEWFKLIHPDDQDRMQQISVPHQDKCFVELHRHFEYRMRHKSGQFRWYRHRAIVDHDGGGNPIRMTGSVGDIHDRKSAEMQAAEEIRRRDNFLAMLSHELRNPMGAVLNAIECIDIDARSSGADQDKKRTVDAGRVIQRQTKHMARLLDDLLDVARFAQSKIELRKEVIDLCEITDEVIEAVSYEIEGKNQVLKVEISCDPLFVYADPARIKQAQVNLLANAIKYTPAHGKIWYQVERIDDVSVITVRDSGEGIPRELLDSIFDMFVQSESTLARSSGGMGVGLSLARSIVEAHDGRILAESEGPRKGSTFRIELPLTEEPARTLLPPPNSAFDGSKLLLVEDNDDARSMLSKMLQLRGFEVVDVGNGQAALELFEAFEPEFAVIDIGLPEMNGYELAREVRKRGFEPKLLVALTGYGRESDQAAARDAGFDAHLVKPLQPEQLYQLIAESHSAAKFG